MIARAAVERLIGSEAAPPMKALIDASIGIEHLRWGDEAVFNDSGLQAGHSYT